MVVAGDGELGFDSERSLKAATTSKEGSRRANYPILTREVVTINNNTGLLSLVIGIVQSKSLNEDPLEGKSGASSALRISPNPARKVSRNIQLNSLLSPTGGGVCWKRCCNVKSKATRQRISRLASMKSVAKSILVLNATPGQAGSPLSLSISISGGKETNKDSLSSGEREEPSLKIGRLGVGVVWKRPQRRTGPKFPGKGAREVRARRAGPCRTTALSESGCLGMQPQSGGKFRQG
ncbi:hypothetical protein Bca4012_103748 [Brassica carinata]